MINLDDTVTLKQIIDDNIYGGWVLKDRIIPVFEAECHVEMAYEILQTILKFSDQRIQHPRLNREGIHTITKYYPVYRIMYRMGFMRLSIIKNETKLEYSKYLKPNEFQLRIMKRVSYCDPIEIYFSPEFGIENLK